MNVFMKPKNKYYKSYTNYGAAVILYLVTTGVAFIFFIQSEEGTHIGFVIVKSLLWPITLLMQLFKLA